MRTRRRPRRKIGAQGTSTPSPVAFNITCHYATFEGCGSSEHTASSEPEVERLVARLKKEDDIGDIYVTGASKTIVWIKLPRGWDAFQVVP